MIITLLSEAHTETMRKLRTGNRADILAARAWEAECWEAAMIVRRYQQRVRMRQEAGITARQRLDLLRNDIADWIDIKMMRTP